MFAQETIKFGEVAQEVVSQVTNPLKLRIPAKLNTGSERNYL